MVSKVIPQIHNKNKPAIHLVDIDLDNKKTFTVGILESSTKAIATKGSNPTNISGEVIVLKVKVSKFDVDNMNAMNSPVVQKIISKNQAIFNKVLDSLILISL